MTQQPQQKNQVWFWPALTVIFVGLKLADVISWSWVWVTAPVWLPLAAVTIIWLVMVVVLTVVVGMDKVIKGLVAQLDKPKKNPLISQGVGQILQF